MLSKEERENFDIDPVIRFCYDYILPISNDRVLATHGDEISLITKDGEMIATYDSIEVPSYDDFDDPVYSEDDKCYIAKTKFIDNILIYRDDGLYGLLDYNGEILLEAEYYSLKFYDETHMEIKK